MTTEPELPQASRIFTRCPYLGSLKDPNVFVNSPSRANLCYKCEPIAVPSRALQKKICLSPLYAQCPIYKASESGVIPEDLHWKKMFSLDSGWLAWGAIPLVIIGFLVLIFLVGNQANWWRSLPLAVLKPTIEEPFPSPSATLTPFPSKTPSGGVSGFPLFTASPLPSVTTTQTITATPTQLPFLLRIFPPRSSPTPTATPIPSATVVTFEPGPYYYRGYPYKATGVVTGLGGLNEPISVSYSGDCTNVSAQGCTATATYMRTATHAASSDTKHITIIPAPSTTVVTFETGPYVYRGSAYKATAMVTGVAGLNAPVNVTYSGCLNAGSCTATATYPGDVNHSASTGSSFINITKAPSTVTVTFGGGPFVYSGTPFTATAVATGVGMPNTSVTPSYSGDCVNVNASGCTAVASFGGDVNHGGAIASAHITIAKAPTTTTVSFPGGPTYVYKASQFTATAVVTGAGSPSQTVSWAYTPSPCIDAGSCMATATYIADGNHNPSTGSASITIQKAPSTVAVTFESGPYTFRGSTFTATAIVSGIGLPNTPVTPAYGGDCINVTSSNGCTGNGNYAGDKNHNSSSGSSSITIVKAPVTLTAGTLNGAYTGGLHFPSACSVTGTYTGGLGCTNNPSSFSDVGSGSIAPVLALNGQSAENYAVTPVNGSWSITPAPVTMTAGSFSGTFNGNLRSVSACTVSGAYTGNLGCSNSQSTVGPNAGSGSITPTLQLNGENGGNFTVTPVDGSWSIAQASVTMNAGNLNATYNGNAHSPSSCNVSGDPTGNLSCTNSPTSVTNAGSGNVTPTMNYGGESSANFSVTSNNGSWTISPAPVTVTAGSYSGTYDGATHSPSACSVTGSYTGSLTCSNVPDSVGPDPGSGTISPSLQLNGENGGNFSPTYVDGAWQIV